MIDYKKAFETMMIEYGVFDELTDHILQECGLNRPELDLSENCICYSCGRRFKAREITDWCDDDMTAICPYCSVDKVVAESSGVPQDSSFMAAYQELYRKDNAGDMPVSEESRYIWVAHHPLRPSLRYQRLDFDDFPLDTARVVFDGVKEPGRHRFSDGDEASALCIDFDVYGSRTRVRYGLEGMVEAREYLRDGVLHKIHVPLCDAEEAWDFAISRFPLPTADFLAGYVETGSESNCFVSTDSLEERARYFDGTGYR